MNLGGTMKSPVVKRSIVIAGHKTSVSLEEAFWSGLKQIASGCDPTLSEMVSTIDAERAHGNLSSAIRFSCSITTEGRSERRLRKHRVCLDVIPPNSLMRGKGHVPAHWFCTPP